MKVARKILDDYYIIFSVLRQQKRSTELKEAAIRLTVELRRAGIRAEMSYGDPSLKA